MIALLQKVARSRVRHPAPSVRPSLPFPAGEDLAGNFRRDLASRASPSIGPGPKSRSIRMQACRVRRNNHPILRCQWTSMRFPHSCFLISPSTSHSPLLSPTILSRISSLLIRSHDVNCDDAASAPATHAQINSLRLGARRPGRRHIRSHNVRHVSHGQAPQWGYHVLTHVLAIHQSESCPYWTSKSATASRNLYDPHRSMAYGDLFHVPPEVPPLEAYSGFMC